MEPAAREAAAWGARQLAADRGALLALARSVADGGASPARAPPAAAAAPASPPPLASPPPALLASPPALPGICAA
jgi:hypothetical protein